MAPVHFNLLHSLLLHHDIKSKSNPQVLHTYRKCSSFGTLAALPLPSDQTYFAQPKYSAINYQNSANFIASAVITQ